MRLPAYLWACGGLADVKHGIGCRAAYTAVAKRRETNILFLTSAQSGCGARKTSCLYGLLAFVSSFFPPRFFALLSQSACGFCPAPRSDDCFVPRGCLVWQGRRCGKLRKFSSCAFRFGPQVFNQEMPCCLRARTGAAGKETARHAA